MWESTSLYSQIQHLAVHGAWIPSRRAGMPAMTSVSFTRMQDTPTNGIHSLALWRFELGPPTEKTVQEKTENKSPFVISVASCSIKHRLP
jgi:hypothetical protein